MKTPYKFFLLIAAFIASNAAVKAQSFECITRPGNINITNSTIQIFINSNEFDDEYFVDIKNVSSTTKNVRIIRQELQVVPGTTNFFCWNLCFPEHVDSSGILAINPQQIRYDFHSRYKPNAQAGETILRYKLMNDNNPNDTAFFILHFIGDPSSIHSKSNDNGISQLFPNPANKLVNLQINQLNTSSTNWVQILDVSGRMVRDFTIHQGQISLDVADLNDGIYFVRLVENGVARQPSRFIVKH